MEEQKLLGKKLSSDAELIMWLSSEDKNNIDKSELKFPLAHLCNRMKGKDYAKLIKIAKQCELFYIHKCKNEYINKYCLNCTQTNFHQNDLIRFINIETFLYYMKYMFYVSNNIVAYSKSNFNENKKDFENIINNSKEIKEKWKFKGAKIICKQCMLKLINKPNFFENIKEILFRKKSQNEKYNQIELNEENDIYDNNNENSNKFSDEKNIIILNLDKKSKKQMMKNDSNIIINYNNPNNNIFNTIIFNNNLTSLPSFENTSKINFEQINSNYIQALFISIENELNNILNTLELFKLKKYNNINCLSKMRLINYNINSNINLLINSIKTNLNFLNIFMPQNDILKNYSNIVLYLINDNTNMINLLNRLYTAIINIEDIFIKYISNDCNDITFNLN